MSYNHKKSLRKVTDVQMSEGTSVDGSRIDRALDESTDRFNNLEGGDFAQMFTKTQFVFGMQPSPIVAAPLADPTGATGTAGYNSIKSINTSYNDGSLPPYNRYFPISGQWLPWLPIKNNKWTTHATDSSGGTYPLKFDRGETTPTGGFENKWRFKGTNVVNRPDMSGSTGAPPVLSNGMGGRWESGFWSNVWSGQSTWTDYDPEEDAPQPHSPYQFAWSHSWEFPDPIIVDEIMIFVRTDRPYDASREKYTTGAPSSKSGWYDAPYEYKNEERIGGEFHIFSSRDVMFQMSVDNPFSTEERNYNDIQSTFNSRPMDGWRVTEIPTNSLFYNDMSPNSPEYNSDGTQKGDGLCGRMIRFSGLNLPIRKLARLRLSVILPWYVSSITDAGYQKQISITRGLSPSRWNAETSSDGSVAGNTKTASPAPSPNAVILGAPWDNCSINGCMTILEDVQD